MTSFGKDFRAFIEKGNIIEIAVGLILALALADVVKSLTTNVITPIIGIFGGIPDLSGISFTINNSVFGIGLFLNAVLNFLIVAFILFLIVRAATRVYAGPPATPAKYAVVPATPDAMDARGKDGWTVVAATGDGNVVMMLKK
jgi:large conductance mechanosensitive channel